MAPLPWEIEKIIEVARSLLAGGDPAASTGERIAAAFVLNRQDYLPPDYADLIEAWDHLGSRWQQHVRTIKREHRHCIPGL
ncbi:MAG: hypothetical protein HY749_03100 [Gammaproteobacteria bacterium]|nr:hypothetical protein [Gammaproteobacteria bacterium]